MTHMPAGSGCPTAGVVVAMGQGRGDPALQKVSHFWLSCREPGDGPIIQRRRGPPEPAKCLRSPSAPVPGSPLYLAPGHPTTEPPLPLLAAGVTPVSPLAPRLHGPCLQPVPSPHSSQRSPGLGLPPGPTWAPHPFLVLNLSG